MRIHLLVLNYNGRHLLEECLPSVIEAAKNSQHRCEVAVIDNSSRDDSIGYLARRFPRIPVFSQPNRGLCSFNEVLPQLDGPITVLLNNDVFLDPHAIDPLVEPVIEGSAHRGGSCFMAAPRCHRAHDGTYEGLLTAIRWRYGLVQATSLFAGCETIAMQPGPTASAGSVMAVCRERFLRLGGFDPLYLPGRLEDLDFAFRSYMCGFHACYVPESVVWHRGMATFGRYFGKRGCDRLALRNTLLFQWKNLRHPVHLLRQWLMLPVRLLRDAAPATGSGESGAGNHFFAAFSDALRRWRRFRSGLRPMHRMRREWAYFRRFHPKNLLAAATVGSAGSAAVAPGRETTFLQPGSASDHQSPGGAPAPNTPVEVLS